MRAREIMVLVTGAALNRIYSLPIGSASDLHRVLVAIVSLTREISGRVTIHAPRMAQYRHDSLKGIRRRSVRFGLCSGIENQQEGS